MKDDATPRTPRPIEVLQTRWNSETKPRVDFREIRGRGEPFVEGAFEAGAEDFDFSGLDGWGRVLFPLTGFDDAALEDCETVEICVSLPIRAAGEGERTRIDYVALMKAPMGESFKTIETTLETGLEVGDHLLLRTYRLFLPREKLTDWTFFFVVQFPGGARPFKLGAPFVTVRPADAAHEGAEATRGEVLVLPASLSGASGLARIGKTAVYADAPEAGGDGPAARAPKVETLGPAGPLEILLPLGTGPEDGRRLAVLASGLLGEDETSADLSVRIEAAPGLALSAAVVFSGASALLRPLDAGTLTGTALAPLGPHGAEHLGCLESLSPDLPAALMVMIEPAAEDTEAEDRPGTGAPRAADGPVFRRKADAVQATAVTGMAEAGADAVEGGGKPVPKGCLRITVARAAEDDGAQDDGSAEIARSLAAGLIDLSGDGAPALHRAAILADRAIMSGRPGGTGAPHRLLTLQPPVARTGEDEGEATVPMTPELRATQAAAVEIARDFFDPDYYLEQNPGLGIPANRAFEHFLTRGFREDRNPAPWFQLAAYHPRRRLPGGKLFENPFLAYIVDGMMAGDRLDVRGDDGLAGDDYDDDDVATAIRPVFDADYYQSRYADIRKNAIEPLWHYIMHGHKEGRDPAAWFSTDGYKKMYPDVARSGVNPLFHYVRVGKARGFRPVSAEDGAKVIAKSAEKKLGLSRSLRQLVERRPAGPPVPVRPIDRDRLDLHWIIPDYTPGAGGHMTIFRTIHWLEFFGHKCTVWVVDPRPTVHPTGWRDDVIRHFQPIAANVRRMSPDFDVISGDAVIATGWNTVSYAMSTNRFAARYYFVQDFEPAFFARGAHALAAEMTYSADLACICASEWLRGLMSERFGRWARAFRLAYDAEAYHPPETPRDPEVKRIAFYARSRTERRAVELGLLALEELARRRDDFEVDFYGDDRGLDAVPFFARDHGILSAEELGELYRECTIGVCFSATNYSLVPQEMMACGLPVVELDNESTRRIYADGAVVLAGPDPVSIADRMEELLDDPALRDRVRAGAQAWVEGLDWETSVRDVEAAIRAYMDETLPADRFRPASPAVAQKRPTATVAIPTYNAGPVFETVLARVQEQRAPWDFEVVVCDSGSTDGTWELVEGAKDVQTIRIDKSEFQHGATRNLMVERSSGDFVAFITHDAIPTDRFWLYNLVTALGSVPGSAGAFGRHVPYPDADPFTKRDLKNHFKGFLAHPLVTSQQTDRDRWIKGDEGWRRFMHFYSDNNSCLRRTAWEDVRLPDVFYGEDQLWAEMIARAGYARVYAPWATVIHSHDYDYAETFERAVTEAKFFHDYFGYELVRDRAQAEEMIAANNAADTDWGFEKGLSRPVILRRLTLNRAKVEGWLAGLEAARG